MNELFTVVWRQKILFLSTFFLVFTLSYLLLMALDFLPEAPVEKDESSLQSEALAASEESASHSAAMTDEMVGSSENETSATTSEGLTEMSADVLPLRMSIQRLNKDITVLNPTSRSIADLDEALLTGVVRHPDSATLAQEGNVFILGHSSYLPNVFNESFQAFNGIQDLEWGDTIELFSDTTVYTYRVEKVYRANAQDVTVPIAGTGNMLTLATCNSFGSVDDRYIVEAVQKNVRSL